MCNSSYESGSAKYTIVCGVGLNVFNKEPTTCLAELWPGATLSKEKLLADFMNILEESWSTYVQQVIGSSPLLLFEAE